MSCESSVSNKYQGRRKLFYGGMGEEGKKLKKPQLFYEPQLTQHCKKYTPATQPKVLLTLRIFQ